MILPTKEYDRDGQNSERYQQSQREDHSSSSAGHGGLGREARTVVDLWDLTPVVVSGEVAVGKAVPFAGKVKESAKGEASRDSRLLTSTVLN